MLKLGQMNKSVFSVSLQNDIKTLQINQKWNSKLVINHNLSHLVRHYTLGDSVKKN